MHGKLKVLNPERIRIKNLSCTYCNLSYSKDDYRSLYYSKKLIYFKALDSKLLKRNEKICQNCLLALSEEEPLSFEIETENFKIGIEIDPKQEDNGSSDDLIDGLFS